MTKRNKNTVTSKVAESAYFHTGNSGVTISMKEITTTHTEYDTRRNYRLEVKHGAHGAYSSFDAPLGSVHMVDWMIDALTRLRDRMGAHGFDAEYAFEYAQRGKADDYVTIRDGLRREDVWRETVTSVWGTESRVVAYQYFDGDTLVMTEPASSTRTMGSECCGTNGTPRYKPEDIGKEVVNGKVVD